MKGENKLLIEKSLTQTIEKEFFLNVHQNLSAHIQDNTSLKSNSMQTKIEEQYSLESDNSTFDFQTDCEVKAGNQKSKNKTLKMKSFGKEKRIYFRFCFIG
ncbi:hypothetical protein P8650_000851 [Campylobacter coli]|nr:hypothetical protein [Campylobacter coli]